MRVLLLVTLFYMIPVMLAIPTTDNHARVYMMGKSGISGIVDVIQGSGGLLLIGRISGLTPGYHGFHVHEWGDVFSKACDSTGEHFNPRKMQHGGPNDTVRHLGDFGNIVADSAGIAEIYLFIKDLSLSGPDSIVGRAFVVHAE